MKGIIMEGTNNQYMIFPNGNVMNVNSGKILKPQLHTKGYLQVQLSVKCKPIKKFIHRLLANYFIDNPNNLPTINHKDGNKLNNSLSNLEWCSYSYNNKHAYDNNLTTSRAKKIEMLSINNKKLKTFNSTVEAEQFLQKNGFLKAHNTNISSVALGKRKTAYGYKWRYLE
jgi:hypothetical protein